MFPGKTDEGWSVDDKYAEVFGDSRQQEIVGYFKQFCFSAMVRRKTRLSLLSFKLWFNNTFKNVK